MKEPRRLRNMRWIHLALLAALAVYLVGFTDLLSFPRERDESRSLSQWVVNGEQTMDINEFSAGEYGGPVILECALPDTLEENEALCFSSNNANFSVFLDGKRIYGFHSRQNFTGWGYGVAYHTVALSPEDAGHTVRLEVTSCFDQGASKRIGGRIGSPIIETDENYRHMLFDARLPDFVLSVLVLLTGIGFLVFHVVFFRRLNLAYRLTGLGVGLILIGLWCLGDTSIPQMVSGHLYAWRTIDYTALHLAVYPVVAFVNSLTHRERKIYSQLSFIVPTIILTLLMVLRFGLGIDMNALYHVIYVDYLFAVLIIGVMLLDNLLYCRKNRVSTQLGLFHVGMGCFALGAIVDLILYIHLSRSQIILVRGTFLRVGLTVFAVLAIYQSLRSWFTERATVNRDRFLNKILTFAVASGDAEDRINAMLEYLCTELHADRAYIFEDMRDGTFDNTYEWCREGVTPEIDNLKGLPYEGVVDVWYNEYKKANRVLIYDIEEYRKESENMYNVLKPQGIQTLVTGPMEASGEYIGFFGVDNPLPETMREISEIIRLLSYVFAQMVLHRDDQKKLQRYSYYDALTNCRNRRALEEFEKQELDPAKPYGYVVCDINGLKQTNDTLGHEAGDALILDVATCMSHLFGAENVYRTGGDEFVAYAQRDEQAVFDREVAQLRDLLAEHKRSAAVGAVFRPQGDPDYQTVKREADTQMYENKRKFYQGANDRRKRD